MSATGVPESPPAYASRDACVPASGDAPRTDSGTQQADVEAQEKGGSRPRSRAPWLLALFVPPMLHASMALMQVAYLAARSAPSGDALRAQGPLADDGSPHFPYASFRAAALGEASEWAGHAALWLAFCAGVVLGRGGIAARIRRWSKDSLSLGRQETAALGVACVLQAAICVLDPVQTLIMRGYLSAGHVLDSLCVGFASYLPAAVLARVLRAAVPNGRVSAALFAAIYLGAAQYALHRSVGASLQGAIPIEELLGTRAYGLAAAQVASQASPHLPASSVYVQATSPEHCALVSPHGAALLSALSAWPVAPGTSLADLEALRPVFAKRDVPFAYDAEGRVYFGEAAAVYRFWSGLMGAIDGACSGFGGSPAGHGSAASSAYDARRIGECCAVEEGACFVSYSDGTCKALHDKKVPSVWSAAEYAGEHARRLLELRAVTAHEVQHVCDRIPLAAHVSSRALPGLLAAAAPWWPAPAWAPLAVALTPVALHAAGLAARPAHVQVSRLFERRADAAVWGAGGREAAAAHAAYMRRALWADAHADGHPAWAAWHWDHPTMVSRILAASAAAHGGAERDSSR